VPLRGAGAPAVVLDDVAPLDDGRAELFADGRVGLGGWRGGEECRDGGERGDERAQRAPQGTASGSTRRVRRRSHGGLFRRYGREVGVVPGAPRVHDVGALPFSALSWTVEAVHRPDNPVATVRSPCAAGGSPCGTSSESRQQAVERGPLCAGVVECGRGLVRDERRVDLKAARAASRVPAHRPSGTPAAISPAALACAGHPVMRRSRVSVVLAWTSAVRASCRARPGRRRRPAPPAAVSRRAA
jgi:hypothetical protein